MRGGVDSVFDIWGSFLYIHTHTQHTQPTLLAAYICYHGDERLGMMALRLVRAGVKTGDVQLASKYSSRCLHGCFQHPYFGKLGEHLTRRRPALRLFPSTRYERFTHATAGIKVPLTPVWASPVRSSTTEEESASEYSLPASDLFMRANKAIRWENLPSGRSMCVFCATECWKVPRRDPFPASWLLWGAGISLCQKLVRFRVYIYPHLCPPPPRVGLQSLVRERRSPLRLKESVCNWNRSYSSLIAQTLSGRGWGGGGWISPTSRTNRQTPGVLWGYHYGSTRLYTSSLDQNKAGHFGWLNQAGCASQTHCGSESLPTLFQVWKSLSRRMEEWFARSFLACSHWSAVLGDSRCDSGAQLNLKLLI